jgi:hypothetical protein
MIALTGQTWAAMAMVAVAAIYLTRCAWRAMRGTSAGPGCCGSGCQSARKNTDSAEPQPQSGGNFVPLDNLADLARRHKQESDR